MTASDYQLDVNGTILGDGTAWEIKSWGGLEEFSSRGSDVPFPTAWGSIPGSSYVNSKFVQIVTESVDPSNVLLLEASLVPPQNAAPDALLPIRHKFPNREEMLMYGRIGRRARLRDEASTFGKTGFAFEMEFPDPRIYSAVLQQASLTVFVAGGAGFEYSIGAGANLGFDYTLDAGTNLGFDYTGTNSSGLQTITNLGYIDSYPIFVFAPATGISSFTVTNQTTGQVLTINQTVPAGQTLIADMMAAATSMSSGAAALPMSIGGSSVYAGWQPPRTPFRLVPGPNVLRFDVAIGDSTATALITAPSAYL